jgi:DNA-binding PadR family transcriptional regulator
VPGHRARGQQRRRPRRRRRVAVQFQQCQVTVLLGRADDLHGWAIMKATKRSGPTVYGVLDRLEDAGWISGRWEDANPEPGKPRRRLYSITSTGVIGAQEILRERRPQPPRSERWAPGPALPRWQHGVPRGSAT